MNKKTNLKPSQPPYLSKSNLIINTNDYLNKYDWFSSEKDMEAKTNKISKIDVKNVYFTDDKNKQREYVIYIEVYSFNIPYKIWVGNPSSDFILKSIFSSFNWENECNLFPVKKNFNVLNHDNILDSLQTLLGKSKIDTKKFQRNGQKHLFFVPDNLTDQSNDNSWTKVSCDVDDEYNQTTSNHYLFSLYFEGKTIDEIKKSIIYNVEVVFGYKEGWPNKNF